jgi:hypothetical protein
MQLIIYFMINFLFFVSLTTLIFVSYLVVTSRSKADFLALIINLLVFYLLYWLKYFIES